MAAGSAGAAAFAAWRSALTTRLCAEPVFAPLRDDSVHGPLFAPYLVARRPASGWPSSRWSTRGTPFGIDVRRLATEALEDAAGHPDAWGDTHVFAPDPRLRPGRRGPRAAGGAGHAGVRRHRHRALHRLAAGAHRRGLPRLGRPLRLGPRRPRAAAAGWCRWAPRATPGRRTTSTSSRPGPTPGCCRSSWTGSGSPSRTVTQLLLEPRLRVGVVVVALDVAVARALVHRDRLDEGAVGVQPDRSCGRGRRPPARGGAAAATRARRRASRGAPTSA